MSELLKLYADDHVTVWTSADQLSDGEVEPPRIRTYRPADRSGIRRLYSEALLDGSVDPYQSTADLDDPLHAYFIHSDDRLWVAEHGGRVVGMIGVGHLDHHVAQVRRLRVENSYRHTDLVVRLIKVVLDHCRQCGDLKLVLDSPIDPSQAVAACRDGGFQYTRERRSGGRASLEFYLNLYQQPRLTSDDAAPRRAPRPPRLRYLPAL